MSAYKMPKYWWMVSKEDWNYGKLHPLKLNRTQVDNLRYQGYTVRRAKDFEIPKLKKSFIEPKGFL